MQALKESLSTEVQEIQSNTQKISETGLKTLGKTKSIKLPVLVNNNLSIGEIEYKSNEQITSNEDFAMGIIYLIESSGANYDKIAIWSFKEACKSFEVTCDEAIEAYWLAYRDPYVGKEGIQFRHLWKHIEKIRNGSGTKLYTYQEMLSICDKEHISTDHFEFIEKEKWKRK
ncbi:MAG: hypothetical protein RIE52_12025 [Balneola sp.]